MRVKGSKRIPLTLVGAILAVAGFLAVVLFGSVLGGGRVASTAVTQRDVVVAAHDIPVRSSIGPGDLTVARMALDDVPPGAFEKREQLKGLVSAVDVVKGQALTPNLLVTSADLVTGAHDFLAIPSGFVVLTVPTSEFQGAGGYIVAGDYIAMTVITNVKGQSVVRTVYTNLHVLKVGPAGQEQTQPLPGGKPLRQGGALSSSLSLVVTQCQAEIINWFLANATIKYTLESYRDYKPQDTRADGSCPSVDSAQGVRPADINARWPGLAG